MSFIGPELPSHLINPKNSENDDEHTEKGPQITPHLVQQSTLNIYDEDDDDDDGPELPPHLRKGSLKEAGPSIPTPPGPSTGKSQVQVGPTFPSYAPTYDPATYHNNEDDDDDDDFGPKPLPAGMQHQQTDAVKEFIEREEKRRKLAEVCSKHLFYNFIYFILLSCSVFFYFDQDAAKPKSLQRDEWMLVPPSSSSLLGSELSTICLLVTFLYSK